MASGNVPDRELNRAKENLKGRILLSMESTSARMNRLGKSLITDSELLSLERLVAEVDAVEASSVAELAAALLAPEHLSAAGIGPDEDKFMAALAPVTPSLDARERVNVLLNGRGGKVGVVLGPALEAAGHTLVPALADADAIVDFTRPDAVVGNVLAAIEAGVPAIVGTSGWDPAAVDEAARTAGLPVFFAPNFAIGAVLMMRFAAQAHRHLPAAAIIELHHDTKVDAPSGTAKATAERLGGSVPIHSVRLPGLVAHQEVLLRASRGEVLTIRHDATSREAYVPGVLLALERLASLPPGVTVGLDALL